MSNYKGIEASLKGIVPLQLFIAVGEVAGGAETTYGFMLADNNGLSVYEINEDGSQWNEVMDDKARALVEAYNDRMSGPMP